MKTSSNSRWLLSLICVLALPAALVAQESAPSAEPVSAQAPAVAAKNSSPWQIMIDGGPLMWPILGCSIVLSVFVLERLFMLRRARVAPKMFIQKFQEQLKTGQVGRDAALELCAQNGSPVASVFAAAVKKWGRPAVELEQAVIDAGEHVTYDLRRYLRLFNGISSVSPLLGLLGTVLGMISSFNAIVSSNAMGRAELLAGGIGQALLTTAGGLFVAIPALVAFMFFQGRVEALLREIDIAAQQVIDIVSAESLERDASVKPTKKSKAAA